MQPRHPRIRACLCTASLLLSMPACTDDGAGPGAPPPAGGAPFHPLGVGSAWVYDSRRVVRFIAAGGGDARPPIDQSATSAREIVTTELIEGRTWSVEEERFFAPGSSDTVLSWRRYREDGSGLYRADLPTTLPPGAGTGLDSVSAALRLAYPRSVGAVWFLHEGDPAETGSLLRIDTLETAAGTSPAFVVAYHLVDDGPADRRLFWYSARGILASEVYREVVAVDAGSGETIVVQSTETHWIRETRLPAAGAPRKITRRGRWTGTRPAPVRR